MSLVLGVDIGSSSSKAVVAAADGSIVATAIRPHALSMPRPGWAEHDAEDVWWGGLQHVLGQLAESVSLSDIDAVCPSGIGLCVLPTDGAGTPLRPEILYGIDTRATAQIGELNRRYTPRDIVARGGSELTTQAIGPKLLWSGRTNPTWLQR